MAKFAYRMQSILNIKEKLEEQAKLAFGAALRQLTVEEERLQRLHQRRIQYLAEGAMLRQTVLEPFKLRENAVAQDYIKEAIKEQIVRVRKANEAVERARHVLQEYMIERKTYEQLKEVAFEAFKQDLAKEESKEVDELVSYVYSQKSH